MDDTQPRTGNIVIGIMLVVIGVAIALARAGVVAWPGQWTLWPLILVGIGLARFVQSPAGGPKEGLLLMTAGAWLAAGQAGWWPLDESWPILVIAFGLIVALNGGVRFRRHGMDGDDNDSPDRPWRRRHRRGLTPLAVIGVWIAIVVGMQVSGMSGFNQFSGLSSVSRSGPSDRVHVFSIMGRSERTTDAGPFQAGDMTNIMGRSELDLRNATIPPGGEATLEVFSMMGSVTVRVPPNWTVDTRALPAMGAVRDQRFSADKGSATDAGPAPRLVLRGVVLMGRLVIAS